ncbi:Zinc finger DNA binding protein [Operophtera brumata]|uniref:Zinc finger DNA binding protein n=1 Tax=Operophtera brumata TaxID=104452 RepID=A0A0L7L6E2_OPEBR|nr:Zinc finger DNA binding protein [Operophtera brumata]
MPPKIDVISTSDSEVAKTSSKGHAKLLRHASAKRVRVSDDEDEDRFLLFKNEIKEIVSSLKKRLDSLEKNISDINGKSDLIQNSNKEIEKSIELVSGQVLDVQKKIENLDDERKKMSAQIYTLEYKLENYERLSKKYCIEIRNAPKNTKETKSYLFHMINKLNVTLDLQNKGCTIQPRDVYRLPNKGNATSSTIVVELFTIVEKETLLRNVKIFSRNRSDQLNSGALGFKEPRTPIYISEHLTSHAKRLLHLARDFAKTEGYQFCWTSGGRVFLRKKENASHILVKGDETLASLRGGSKL